MCVHEAQWDLPVDLESVGKAREVVRQTLIEWELGDLVDDTLLVISELCTNAILYGGEPITVTLRGSGRCLGGEVSDGGGPFVSRSPASEDDEHGRGLHIVAALVDRWGVDHQGNGDGKTVWFTMYR